MKFDILRQSGLAFFGKMMMASSSILLGMVLARTLSPDDLGAYFLAFSIVSSIALIAVFGLNTSVVKFVAAALAHDQFGRARRAISLAVALAASFAGLLAIAYSSGGGAWLVGAFFKSQALAALSVPVAIWIFLAVMQNILAECFRGLHQVGRATLITSSNAVLLFTIVGFSALISNRLSLQNVLLYSIAVLVVVVGFAGFWLLRETMRLSGAGSLSAGELLRTSAPNGVTNAIYFMLSQFDLWIVGAYHPGSDVAIYGAAAKLVRLVSIPLMIVSLVAPPLVARMYAAGEARELQKILRAFATLAGWPAILVLMLFVCFGQQILGGVYGGFYAQGSAILVVLSLGQIINVWTGSCGIVLSMSGNQRILMVITLLCGSFVFGLGLLAGKYYGILAVAVVAAAGMVLQNILMLFAARRATGVWSHMQLNLMPWAGLAYLKQAGKAKMAGSPNEQI